MIKEKKVKNYILYALGEIILVMVGILLALQVNNWNETKKIEKSVTTTLNLLKDEINTNKDNINKVKEYHIMVRDTIESLEVPESENDIKNSLNFWRGMQTPRMQDAAFQTSIQSGASKEFHPLLLQTLNNLYTSQESYNDFTSSSSQIFFNADFSDFKDFSRIMTSIQMTMADLYYSERELTVLFDDSLKKIDSLNTHN